MALTDHEKQEIRSVLDNDYVILKRNRWWYVLGGAVTVAVAIFAISWAGTAAGLHQNRATNAMVEAEAARDRAKAAAHSAETRLQDLARVNSKEIPEKAIRWEDQGGNAIDTEPHAPIKLWYAWSRVGTVVTLEVRLEYATAGKNCGSATIKFSDMSDLPTPKWWPNAGPRGFAYAGSGGLRN